LGDTSILTPGGKAQEIGDNQYETFKGGVVQVGNLKVQPAKGTLKSFTVTGEDVDHGAARFVAMFDTKTGAFTGYSWDKKLSYTYKDFVEDFKQNLVENLDHANDPMWDQNLPSNQAGKRALSLGIAFASPSVYIRPLTIVTNTAKILKPLGLGSTGRIIASNLSEQLAMEEVLSNPTAGEIIQKMAPLSDARWLGWRKMQYIKELGDGSMINIHYVGKWVNGVLKAVDDFKFK
jgi:hypothetical protein